MYAIEHTINKIVINSGLSFVVYTTPQPIYQYSVYNPLDVLLQQHDLFVDGWCVYYSGDVIYRGKVSCRYDKFLM